MEANNAASVAMYPSLMELLSVYLYTDIPEEIVVELRRRYDAHGWEYATGLSRVDGRVTNACMDADSRREAKEELTDAIFNLLVLHMKGESWIAQAALAYVLHAWMLLSPQQDSGTS